MQIEELLALLTLAAAFLQIILFFKLWIMTNDVKKLREICGYSNKSNFNFEIRKLLASGSKEKAKEMLLNRFYDSISELNYSGLDKSENNYEQITKNIDADFLKLKERLANDLSKIGEQLPENIKQMKSGNDFYELFN